MYRNIFIALFLFTTSLSTVFADSHADAAKAFLNVMQPQADKIKGLKKVVDQIFKRIPQDKHDKKGEVLDLFVKKFNTPERVSIESTVYKEAFTEKELIKMAAFMKTAFGKKIKEQMPKIISKAAKANKAYDESHAKQFQQELLKILK